MLGFQQSQLPWAKKPAAVVGGGSISDPTFLGHAGVGSSGTSSTHPEITTLSAVAVDELILVLAMVGGPNALVSAGVGGLSDNSGNGYVWTPASAAGEDANFVFRSFYLKATAGMASGSLLTLSNSSQTFKYIAAYKMSGQHASPVDLAGSVGIGTDAAPTADIDPSTVNVVLFNSLAVLGGQADTITHASGWTQGSSRNASGWGAFRSAWRKVPNANLISKVDSLSASRHWGSRLLAIKGA